MGIFDKFKANVEIENEKEAFFAIVLGAVAADGEISQEEAMELGAILSKKAMFKGSNLNSLFEKCVKILKQNGGNLNALLEMAAPKISDGMKQTAFACALDLVLADGVVNNAEKAVIDNLQKGLNIDEPTAEKMVEVILIKNKG